MSTAATAQIDYSTINRAAINRANSELSTGPRTDAGKQRSSRNALRHGLTARTAVLPSEDLDSYQQHCHEFRDEYQPATVTESHLVQELADTSWRLRRIPLLEARVLSEANRPEHHAYPQPTIQTLANLGLHGARLSRQFHKTLDQLRKIQSGRRDFKNTAGTPEDHKDKKVPAKTAGDGFVFSKDQLDHALRCEPPVSGECPRVSQGT